MRRSISTILVDLANKVVVPDTYILIDNLLKNGNIDLYK
jgi:hypothetical protein